MTDTDELTETPPAEQVEDDTPPEPEREFEQPEREADDVDGPPDEDADDLKEQGDEQARQEQVRTQKEIDAQVSKLEKASTGYLTKIATILGDDLADFKPSPLSLPFLFGFVFDPASVPLDEAVVNATKAFIGDPVPPPLEQAPDAHECPICHGWGQVKTGSKVHPFNVEKCRECNGRGWTGERANVTPAQAAAGFTPEFVAVSDDPTEADELDSWGTPRGHPDYGKMPQYRDPGWSEALEAYKRGEPAPVR